MKYIYEKCISKELSDSEQYLNALSKDEIKYYKYKININAVNNLIKFK